jgi:mRNA-degrading endonuclease YafQ of YafQ-DinJ toxin-antitoxin module
MITMIIEKQRVDYIIEYTQRELSLANFDNHAIASSTLTFIKDLCDLTKCQPKAMTHFTHVLQHLINMKPITPITTNDFEPQEVDAGNGSMVTRHVCTRWSSIYKADDGKYYDDQAVIFRVKNRPDLGSMCIYQGSLSSKKEITLPYVVDPQVVELTEEEAGIQSS